MSDWGFGMEDNKSIEIVVQPIKRIVIFQCTEFSIEEFFKRIELLVISGEPVTLNWAEGIVFLASPFESDSDEIIGRTLKGTTYWSSVVFSSMPKYQPIKKFGAREIPIIDITQVSHLRPVAEWLRKRLRTQPEGGAHPGRTWS